MKKIAAIFRGDYFMLILAGLLLLIFSLSIDNFFSGINMKGLTLSMSTIGMLAPSMMLLLACKHLDLSVGSIVASSGVVVAYTMRLTDGNIILGIAGGIVYGVLWGYAYGYLVAHMKVNAFITTLGGMQIARGLGFLIADGKTIGIGNSQFFVIGNSSFLGVSTPVWAIIIITLIFWYILNKTVFGRNILAIGGNSDAAFLAGINIKKEQMKLFILNGFVGGLVGVILASRLTSGQPQSFQGLELTVISACVLGGVSLNGGVAKISYVVAGVFILGTIENVMNLQGINPFIQYVFRGLILVMAVMVDQFKNKQ